MPKFSSDLKIGKIGENLARKQLDKLGFETRDGDGKKTDFYLTVNGKEYSCEVKYDLYCNKKSGNVAIETYNPKTCKPSGLESTKCDLWFCVLAEDEIYLNSVKLLKIFVENTLPKKEVVGGDNGNAFLKLYQKESICDVGLFRLNNEETLLLCISSLS